MDRTVEKPASPLVSASSASKSGSPLGSPGAYWGPQGLHSGATRTSGVDGDGAGAVSGSDVVLGAEAGEECAMATHPTRAAEECDQLEQRGGGVEKASEGLLSLQIEGRSKPATNEEQFRARAESEGVDEIAIKQEMLDQFLAPSAEWSGPDNLQDLTAVEMPLELLEDVDMGTGSSVADEAGSAEAESANAVAETSTEDVLMEEESPAAKTAEADETADEEKSSLPGAGVLRGESLGVDTVAKELDVSMDEPTETPEKPAAAAEEPAKDRAKTGTKKPAKPVRKTTKSSEKTPSKSPTKKPATTPVKTAAKTPATTTAKKPARTAAKETVMKSAPRKYRSRPGSAGRVQEQPYAAEEEEADYDFSRGDSDEEMASDDDPIVVGVTPAAARNSQLSDQDERVAKTAARIRIGEEAARGLVKRSGSTGQGMFLKYLGNEQRLAMLLQNTESEKFNRTSSRRTSA